MSFLQSKHRIASRAGAVLALSALFVGAGAIESDAQTAMAAKELTFSVEYPELAGRDGVDERFAERPLRAGELAELLAREGRVVYGGREPVEVRLVAFVVGEEGKLRERVVSEPFRLAPRERDEESAPLECALARCVEDAREFFGHLARLFPDGHFFPDSVFFPDGYFFPDDYFFPDSTFDEERVPDSTFDEERFPDTIFGRDYFPDSAFDQARLGDDRIGVMIVAAPADGELQREALLRSALVLFDAAPGAR